MELNKLIITLALAITPLSVSFADEKPDLDDITNCSALFHIVRNACN